MISRKLACAAALAIALPCAVRAQMYPPSGVPRNFSGTIPTTAIDVWPANSAYATNDIEGKYPPQRLRATAMDQNIVAGAPPVATVWCAWGTAAANPAVVGSNGFSLNPGFDETGYGVHQEALNCIQAAGQAHYVVFETR